MTLFHFKFKILFFLITTFSTFSVFSQQQQQGDKFYRTDATVGNGMRPDATGFGQGQARDYGSPEFEGQISSSCPFQAPSASVQALADRVKGALESLKAHADRECTTITPLITQAQQNIDALILTQQNTALTTSGVPDRCVNYEARLRRDLDLAVAENSRQIVSFGPPNAAFSRCKTQPDFNQCANDVYLELLSSQVEQCGTRINGTQNQQIRDNLENLNSNLQGIISGSNSCPSSTVAQSIMQTAIAQATSTASLSAGYGFVGLGVGLAGRLLSSLATRFFNRNNPQQFLNSIGTEEDRHTRFCLFYDVQKANLKCEQSVTAQSIQVAPPTNTDICVDRSTAFDRIGSDINQVSQFIANAATATSASGDRTPASISSALRYNESFGNLIENMDSPVGNTGKSRLDILREMADSLGRSGASINNISSAATIREALRINENITRLRREIGTNPQAVTEIQSQSVEFVKLMTGLPTTALPNNSFNYATALQNHRSLPPLPSSNIAGTTVAGTLNRASAVALIATDSNNYMRSAQNILQNGADDNMLELLLSSSVSQVRPELTRRLREQNQRYQEYRGNRTDASASMRWLGEMLAICMTTQGASYFPNHPTNSMQEMRSSPNDEYRNICSQFHCQDNSIFIPFESALGLGNGTQLERFTNYQCASDRRFPAAVQKLRDNLQRTGNICGSN
jgi:hypothetical protein